MTVRPWQSMTRVAGPRRRKISSFRPVAVTFPSETAIASTNEGAPFVAILALCKMISADTRVSFFVFYRLRERAEACFRPCALLVSRGSGVNCVFGELSGWSTVYHRVRVLDSDSVSSIVVFHNVHLVIVCVLMSQVNLSPPHRSS